MTGTIKLDYETKLPRRSDERTASDCETKSGCVRLIGMSGSGTVRVLMMPALACLCRLRISREIIVTERLRQKFIKFHGLEISDLDAYQFANIPSEPADSRYEGMIMSLSSKLSRKRRRTSGK
jgi:hypothetical protein